MNIYPVEYKAIIWDEFDREQKTVKGVTFSETYTGAVENIEGYYGDSIIALTLFMLEENSVYDFGGTREEHSHGMFKIKNVAIWDSALVEKNE